MVIVNSKKVFPTKLDVKEDAFDDNWNVIILANEGDGDDDDDDDDGGGVAPAA